jgi:Domain of unknown function (DUF1814).
MNEQYKKQVALLIRIMPSVYRIQDFAVHGGTAINLFIKNMPRYSVDIDITYIPVLGREESLREINFHLVELKQMIEKTIPGIKVTHKSNVWKLLCIKDGATVKIEVNGTKRGIFGSVEDKSLCTKAKEEFKMDCKARIVSFTQLYGGKISAALKSLQPNPIDQQDALQGQFEGMTDIPFLYKDYEMTRKELIEMVNRIFTKEDREFLISFEQGVPEWNKCCAGDLSTYPSIKWKLQNIMKLKGINPEKHNKGMEKLREYLHPRTICPYESTNF